ncbi:Putative membrane protein (fragment) [Staphylococcus capitis]
MKHYSIKILIVLILILSLFKIAPVHAENASMSEAYVSITDAKSTISDNSKKG